MSDVDRRNFVGILGAGGLGSMLLGAGALSAEDGKNPLMQALEAATESPTEVPNSPFTPLGVLQSLGVDSTNIAQVRQIVSDTIPTSDLDNMANLLVATRNAYQNSDPASGPPPEAVALEAEINVWLPGLADQVTALTGSKVALGDKLALLSDPDRDPIDWWSLVHFLSGAALGALCFDFWTTLRILIWWEIIEPHIWPGWNESLINQIMDVIIGMLGWFLARLIKALI